MAKSIKNNKSSMKNKKASMKNKRSTMKRRQNMKKMRKNIKRVSLKKIKRGHAMRLKRHYSRGLHKSSSVQYGSSMKGGCGCGATGLVGGKKMKGGMVSSPAAGPVGYSWEGGNVDTWPGVSGSANANIQGATMSNHFSVSPNGIVVGGIEPAESTVDSRILTPNMNGGKRRKTQKKLKKHGKKMKGGFYQEIVNLGRGIQYGVNGGYYDLVGKNQPLSQNPYPTQDQLIDKDYVFIGSSPPDVRKIYIDANNSTAKI